MKIRRLLSGINRLGVLPTLVIFLFGLCAFFHWFAHFEMGGFSPADLRSNHNAALIDFVGGNVHLVVLCFIFFEGLLVFLAIREYPRWSAWLVFCALAVPCLMYLGVCSHFFMPLLAKHT